MFQPLTELKTATTEMTTFGQLNNILDRFLSSANIETGPNVRSDMSKLPVKPEQRGIFTFTFANGQIVSAYFVSY